MNYASDASVEMSKNGLSSATYVSTSFYDRKLCIKTICSAVQTRSTRSKSDNFASRGTSALPRFRD